MKRINLKSNVALIGDTRNSKAIDNEADIFSFNRIEVLNCFTSIEGYINLLIRYEFLGKYSNETKDKIEKFNAKILHTSWFNFSEKRKMTVEILEKLDIPAFNKNKIEKSFRKIMSYRNMLIHGTFLTDGNISELKYYEGTYQNVVLNNIFWDKVKLEFEIVIKLLRQTLKNLEILKVD
jgi:hypothetical protein